MSQILLFGTYIQPPYHPLKGVDALLTSLLADLGTVCPTDNPEDLLKLPGGSCPLLISYLDQFDHAIPEACADAVLRFVQEGGSLLALHNGISLSLDQGLLRVLGGRFSHHPTQEPIDFFPEEDTFLSGIPAFTISEEPYQFDHLTSDNRPLLHYTYRGETYLAGWERTEGRGKIIYLCPGHTIDTFNMESYKQMIRRSVQELLKQKAG